MKKIGKFITCSLLSILLAVAFLPFIGCEDDDDSGTENGDFRISPSSVTMTPGQTSVALSIIGGHRPFTWSVSDTNMGSIGGTGDTVTYTRNDVAGVNVVEATDSLHWIATATINHMSITDLAISPSTATVTANGGTQIFTVSGGTGGPYNWSINGTASGSLSSSSGTSTVYTSSDADDDSVTVSDGVTSASASITKN